jgi:hypothetical protein
VVVLEAELKDPLDRPHGAFPVSQLEQGLAQAGESVLVVGIERKRLLETPPRPRKLLACEVCVGSAYVELDSVGIKGDAFFQDG